MDQFIISVGREFGSGGHEIAEKLAKHYNIPLYDQNLLDEAAAKKNVDGNAIREFDEARKNKFLYRTVRGMSSDPAENIAEMQFDYLRDKAKNGESFVVVGRCAETILKEHPGLIAIFINGDRECKLERIMRLYHLDSNEAEELMKKKDKTRKYYHNSHCDGKWGDSRNYELTINSSKLGVDGSVNLLITYIDTRRAD